MKKLGKLKLNQLSKAELQRRELDHLKGGVCGCVSYCACAYSGEQCSSNDSMWGGSSTEDNGDANANQVAANVSAG